jgi:hypothetical protein
MGTGKRRKLAVELTAIAASFTVVSILGLQALRRGCDPEAFLCQNDYVREFPSPNRSKRIVLFLRGCGATTAYTTDGSILDADERLPDESGNTFTAHGAHLPAIAVDGGRAGLFVAWKSDSEVWIEYPPEVLMKRTKFEVAGVRIVYGPPR